MNQNTELYKLYTKKCNDLAAYAGIASKNEEERRELLTEAIAIFTQALEF